MVALLLYGGGHKGMPVFSAGYSSYQLFKALLQYIAAKDLGNIPQVVGPGTFQFPKPNGSPVLFDAERRLNFLFKMTPWSWRLLQHEAKVTLAALDDSVGDHFDAIFIVRADMPSYRFDRLFEIPVGALLSEGSAEGVEERLSARCVELYNVLAQGLTDRVKLISLSPPEDQAWDVTMPAAPLKTTGCILVGLLLEPANAQRTVDHGPAAEQRKDAASFRKFWGEKAELRRFKDGSILESLVWSEKGDTSTVFQQVLRYILSRNFGEACYQSIKFVNDCDSPPLSAMGASFRAGTAAFQPIMTAFQSLEKQIRDLQDLPLQIRQIYAADPQLCYTSMQAPTGIGRTRLMEPANVVLQFEGSARWPDDLYAVQRTKIAFALRLGDLLEKSVDGLVALVGLENRDGPLLNQSFLDVSYPSGAAFRIRIHHEREAILLESRLKLKSLSDVEKHATANALAAYKRHFLHQPSHTQALLTSCTRVPVLAQTIRLLKQWFSSHLLAVHFAPPLIEMFATRTFTNPFPWPAPSSASSGFLRTLFFLSRWDWRTEPWIVDMSGASMTKKDVAAASTRFEAWRKIDPGLQRITLFVASNVDLDGTTWTDHSRPPKVVAARMTQLAKAATRLVKEEGMTLGQNMANIFSSSLDDYDVVIRLDQTILKKVTKAKEAQGSFKNLQLQHSAQSDDSVSYDPARSFIDEVQQVFGDVLVLFHDGNGGTVIGALWNPQMQKRSWKLKLRFSSMPTMDEGADGVEEAEAHCNRQAILNEIARLGGDLVSAIEVNEK